MGAPSGPVKVGAASAEIGEQIVEAEIAAMPFPAGGIECLIGVGLLQQSKLVELVDRLGNLLWRVRVALPGELVGEANHVEGAGPHRLQQGCEASVRVVEVHAFQGATRHHQLVTEPGDGEWLQARRCSEVRRHGRSLVR